MVKHVYLILFSTFIFGTMCGVLVFLYNNTGNEGDGNIEEESTYIVAHMYGGCESRGGCASYRIDGARRYTYITRDEQGISQKKEGTLTSTERKNIQLSQSREVLRAIENTTFTGVCPSQSEGNGFRYLISYEGALYTFDSCKNELASEKLFSILEDYFEVLKNHP